MPQGEEFALGGVHPVVAGRMNSDSSLLPGSEQVLSLCEVALPTLLEWDSLASLGPCGPGKDFPIPSVRGQPSALTRLHCAFRILKN